MISKELLSEVLGEKKYIVEHLGDKNNSFRIVIDNGDDFEEEVLNVYELSHYCKEWLLYKNIQFSYRTLERRLESDLNHFAELDDRYGFHAESEIEAIFKACQWVLEKRK